MILLGFLFGLVGGIVARFWMRWISTDSEFTWSGTLGIVIGFGIFGAVQATAKKMRSASHSKGRIRIARAFGVVFSLQLFVAAGAMMFPTVLTLSLAKWRQIWPSWMRVLLALTGLALWALIINSTIVEDFGWSATTLAKIVVFGWIYGAIIFALEPTIRAVEKR